MKRNRRASEALLTALKGSASPETQVALQEAQHGTAGSEAQAAPRMAQPPRKAWKCSRCLAFNAQDAAACLFCGHEKA